MHSEILVKLDEGLSRSLVTVVRSHGYQVSTILDQGWSGRADEDFFPDLQKENGFLVTLDTGFGDIRSFPPGSHAGILLVHPRTETLANIAELIQRVLSAIRLDEHRGCLIVVSDNRIRVRHPPSTGK